MTARTLEEIEALAKLATPGEWGYFRHDCREMQHIESYEVTFGDKYGTAWLQSGGGSDRRDLSKAEVEANAALMSSAPRLLEIAQELRAALQEIAMIVNEEYGHDFCEIDMAREIARKAIGTKK